MTKTDAEREKETKNYNLLLDENGAERVLRETVNKTFISRYEFEATYHELYKAKDGKYFAVVRMDPAPGGYGEQYMYIEEVYELTVDDNGKSYSDEELLKLVFSEGKKL